MSGSIGYESAIVTVVLVLCLGTVVRYAGVDLTDGRRVRLVLAGSPVYWGFAFGTLEAFGGGDDTVGQLFAGLLLVSAVAIAAGRLGRT